MLSIAAAWSSLSANSCLLGLMPTAVVVESQPFSATSGLLLPLLPLLLPPLETAIATVSFRLPEADFGCAGFWATLVTSVAGWGEADTAVTPIPSGGPPVGATLVTEGVW